MQIRTAIYAAATSALTFPVFAASSIDPQPTWHHRINTTHCCVVRDELGRIRRSQAVRHQFAKEQPCPSTGEPRLPCPGWRIDHIIPLKRCGPDTLPNLQWLTIDDWKTKSRWE